MRLLFLTSQFPYPPHGGGALRSFGLIDGLHRAGYTVDLLSFADAGENASNDVMNTPLGALCNRIVTVPAPVRSSRQRLRDLLLTPQADMLRRFDSAAYRTALIQMLTSQPYDVVHIVSLEMTSYISVIRSHAPQAKIVYDALNAEASLQGLIAQVDRRSPSRLPASVYSSIQARRLATVEAWVCQQADRVLAVSEADAVELRTLAPNARVVVVPNGIFASEYTAQSPRPLDLGPAALLFTGTMNYRPNVDAMLWFVETVLDEIHQTVPEARLFVVGNRPHGRLERIRRRAHVEITGFVQNILPFLHSATVYVAPLRMGSGTRLKLLQAMAAGCAVVSTQIGAMGLNVSSGREMMLADDATSFAKATVALLRDPALRERLGKAAQTLVCNEYDWSVIVPRLIATYEGLPHGG